MAPKKKGSLADPDRVLLANVMDHLIPPVDDLPGAGSMRLGDEIEKKAQSIPRLRSSLLRVLDALSLDLSSHAAGGYSALDSDRQDVALRAIEQSLPDDFSIFLDFVYTVYYTERTVHSRIGWHGRPPQPDGYEMKAFDSSVLSKIAHREPFWRKA